MRTRTTRIGTSSMSSVKERSARHRRLWAAAYRDREFLIRQIRLYEPSIIIACSVGDIAKQASNGLEWMRPSALNAVLVRGYIPT